MAVAIGRENSANARDPNAQNYCQPGVQATADDATWGEISGFKRSVTFYKREGGQWCYYCQFSMTTDTAAYEPTLRTLLDNDGICAGRSSSSTHPTTYSPSLPAADAVFEAAYLAGQGGDLIRATQRACANMRTQPSMSTACMALPTEGGAATATSYFPVSVCCTSDYCAMRDGSVRFSHLAHAEGHFLLREGKAVTMLAPPSASLSSCEALLTKEEGRYYPLLRGAAVEAACAPKPIGAPSDGAAESEGANATVLALPAPADSVFASATLGLSGHSALVAASQAWCANMRDSRSIATACMRLPATSVSEAWAWLPVSVCCSSDLCQIRDAVSEGAAAAATFAHAARDDGAGGLSHFLIKGGKTVQAVGGAPTATAAECEEAVRKSNLLPDTPYYPLLDTAAVDDICAPSPPPPPPAASPADAAPLPSSSAALGAGAIAGIVVGSVAGGALLLMATWYMLCRGDASASAARKAPV